MPKEKTTPKNSDKTDLADQRDKQIIESEVSGATDPNAIIGETSADPRVQEIAMQMMDQMGLGSGAAGTGTTLPTGNGAGMPVPGAAPLPPEPSITDRIMSIGGLLPIIGPSLTKPLREARENRAKVEATDKLLFEQALGFMDDNPDAFAEVIKDKRYMDAFERHAKIGPEEIESISSMAQNLPMSRSDLFKAIAAGADVEGTFKGPQGSTFQAPEGERQRKAGVKQSLEQEYAASGKDPNSVTPLDVAFADAMSQSGRGRYKIVSNKKGIGFVDTVTGETEDITPKTLKSSNMELVPIEDDFGAVLGFTVVDLDNISNRQEIWFDNMLEDIKAEIAAQMNKEVTDADVEDKAKAKLLKDAKGLLKGAAAEALGLKVEKSIKGAGGQTRVPAQNTTTTTNANDRFF